MSERLEGIVRAAVRRPGLVVALVGLLAVGGGVLALGLRPSAATDTLVGRDTSTFKATERFHQRFGDDAVIVLVREELPQLVLTSDLGRLLGLEGCISGNVPREVTKLPGGANGPCAKLAKDKSVQVVYGPGTFINESVRQIQEQFAGQQQAEAQRETARHDGRAQARGRPGARQGRPGAAGPPGAPARRARSTSATRCASRSTTTSARCRESTIPTSSRSSCSTRRAA